MEKGEIFVYIALFSMCVTAILFYGMVNEGKIINELNHNISVMNRTCQINQEYQSKVIKMLRSELNTTMGMLSVCDYDKSRIVSDDSKQISILRNDMRKYDMTPIELVSIMPKVEYVDNETELAILCERSGESLFGCVYSDGRIYVLRGMRDGEEIKETCNHEVLHLVIALSTTEKVVTVDGIYEDEEHSLVNPLSRVARFEVCE